MSLLARKKQSPRISPRWTGQDNLDEDIIELTDIIEIGAYAPADYVEGEDADVFDEYAEEYDEYTDEDQPYEEDVSGEYAEEQEPEEDDFLEVADAEDLLEAFEQPEKVAVEEEPVDFLAEIVSAAVKVAPVAEVLDEDFDDPQALLNGTGDERDAKQVPLDDFDDSDIYAMEMENEPVELDLDGLDELDADFDEAFLHSIEEAEKPAPLLMDKMPEYDMSMFKAANKTEEELIAEEEARVAALEAEERAKQPKPAPAKPAPAPEKQPVAPKEDSAEKKQPEVQKDPAPKQPATSKQPATPQQLTMPKQPPVAAPSPKPVNPAPAAEKTAQPAQSGQTVKLVKPEEPQKVEAKAPEVKKEAQAINEQPVENKESKLIEQEQKPAEKIQEQALQENKPPDTAKPEAKELDEPQAEVKEQLKEAEPVKKQQEESTVKETEQKESASEESASEEKPTPEAEGLEKNTITEEHPSSQTSESQVMENSKKSSTDDLDALLGELDGNKSAPAAKPAKGPESHIEDLLNSLDMPEQPKTTTQKSNLAATETAELDDLIDTILTQTPNSKSAAKPAQKADTEFMQPEEFEAVVDEVIANPSSTKEFMAEVRSPESAKPTKPEPAAAQEVATARDSASAVSKDQSAASLESSLEGMEALINRIELLEKTMAPLADRVTALEKRLASLEGKAAAVSADGDVASRIDHLEQSIAHLGIDPEIPLGQGPLADALSDAISSNVLITLSPSIEKAAASAAAKVIREEILAVMSGDNA